MRIESWGDILFQNLRVDVLELSCPQLAVRPLTAAIPFQVSLLLPQLAAPHPQREALVQALQHAARDLIREMRV